MKDYSNVRDLSDCDNLNKKIVFVRVDFNVSVINGVILDNRRILNSIDTIKYLLQHNAKVVLLSHLGRPNGYDIKYSLGGIIVEELQKQLQDICKVYFSSLQKLECTLQDVDFGHVVLLENLRFFKEESNNELFYTKQLSKMADIYVNDAFSCAHRDHSSITGLPLYLESYAGFSLKNELLSLQKIFSGCFSSIAVIVAGSKISSKIPIIYNKNINAKSIIVGGGIANTLLYRSGYNIHNSIFDKDYDFDINGGRIVLPQDCVTSISTSDADLAFVSTVDDINEKHMILDLGPASIINIHKILEKSDCVIWSGPLGYYENSKYAYATNMVAEKISLLTKKGLLHSIVGGGDTISAIKSYIDGFSHICTGGSAFLQWFNKEGLVGINSLIDCNY